VGEPGGGDEGELVEWKCSCIKTAQICFNVVLYFLYYQNEITILKHRRLTSSNTMLMEVCFASVFQHLQ
jgi:hypothetical protein